MNKIPFFFSVDFEDYYHDKKRRLGHKDPDVLEVPLWNSYEKIQNISNHARGHVTSAKLFFENTLHYTPPSGHFL